MVQKKLFEVDRVRLINIETIDDLVKAQRMLDRAKKMNTDTGTIPFTDENGGNSSINYGQYCDEAKYRIEEYIRQHKIRFDSDILTNNIKYLVNQHDMKISELETILNLSAGYISRATGEDSKRRLSIDTVYEIAALFSVTVTSLITRDIDTESKSIKKVADYLEKLCNQTEDGELQWSDLDRFHLRNVEESFNRYIDDYNQNTMLENDTISPMDNIFITSGRNGDILISDICSDDGRKGFVVCVGCYDSSEEIPFFYTDDSKNATYEFHQIITVYDGYYDSIVTLCENLIARIQTHKSDFRLSDAAQNYLDSYLEGDSDNE